MVRDDEDAALCGGREVLCAFRVYGDVEVAEHALAKLCSGGGVVVGEEAVKAVGANGFAEPVDGEWWDEEAFFTQFFAQGFAEVYVEWSCGAVRLLRVVVHRCKFTKKSLTLCL